jgi:CMD domain protein
MTSPSPSIDVLDELAGVGAGSAIDALRRRRPVTREQLQASSDALFAPVDDAEFPIGERLLVAAFATRLTAEDETSAWYADRARAESPALAEVVLRDAATAAAPGPFGVYPEAGLQSENAEGPRYSPSDEVIETGGARLAAALAHTQLLVSRPRESSSDALDRLLAAGWSTDGIVTLSQLVAFLAFQQRVAAGLRVLAATDARTEADTDTEEATA